MNTKEFTHHYATAILDSMTLEDIPWFLFQELTTLLYSCNNYKLTNLYKNSEALLEFIEEIVSHYMEESIALIKTLPQGKSKFQQPEFLYNFFSENFLNTNLVYLDEFEESQLNLQLLQNSYKAILVLSITEFANSPLRKKAQEYFSSSKKTNKSRA